MAKKITGSVTVDRSAEEIYRMWCHIQDFPKFLTHIKSVTPTSRLTSHWVMEGPLGHDIEWEARITEHEPNRRIAWETVRGDLSMLGRIDFKPLNGRRTEVSISIRYDPEQSIFRAGGLLADPQGDLDADLQRFKAFAEGVPVHRM